MKSIFTLLFVFLLLSGNLFAEKVDVADAKKAAETFIQHLDNLSKKPSNIQLVFTSTGIASPFEVDAIESTAFYYVFNFQGADGYVVMSADDAVVPVLAYSTKKHYRQENQPDAFVKWMDKYRREIQEIISKKMEPGKIVEQQWTRLKTGLPMNAEKNTQTVNPLLTTTWDQMDYYHDLCPYDNQYNEKVATGCVATAMAQIMKYHNHPQNGEGYHTYNHSTYGSLSANFGSATYNWSAMPNNVTSANNSVATLMYHCGVSLDMNYGPRATGGSSTNSLDVVADALKSYFSYGSSTQFVMRQNYSDANWKNLLKDELNNARPMEYAGIGQGSGHAFVCDGYDASDYFHFNWGWSGSYDGYFHIDVLNPGPGGTGAGNSNYNQYQQIVYGIVPESGGGGGGGGTPPGEGSPLILYSYLNINPNPINFYSSFTVSVDIANASGAAYTCDLTAAVFNSDGTNVGFVETKTGLTLDNGFYYSYEFSTEGMPVTPGNYTIGVYSRSSGEDWAVVKDGQYSNNVPATINGPQNDIALYSTMTVNPNPIVIGEGVSIDVNVANTGSYFTGTISADLYTSQGEYEALIGELSVSMDAGYWYANTFTANSIDVEPGTYIIALWNQPSGGDWSLMGSSNEFPNPITIKVVAPGLQEDTYENNDTEANAYVFNAHNNVHTYTTGSNTHIGTDYDYYKFDLDANYKYRIDARVHDGYNSGNGQTYTNDVIFSYNQGNGAGQGYDDVLPTNIIVNGKSSISFFVAPYFTGQTGTYLLDVNLVKIGPAGINNMDASQWVNIYPNPAKDYVHIEISEDFRFDLTQGQVYNAYGQLVYTISNVELKSESFDVDVSQLESGAYFLRMKHEEGIITHKFNVLK